MGLVRGMARTAVVAGTATAVSNRVSRRQANRWAEQEQQAAYQQPVYEAPAPMPQQQPAPGSDMESKLAQLQQLGELKAQGVLSEAEFELQKHKILTS
jgi:Short C-terminal domain